MIINNEGIKSCEHNGRLLVSVPYVNNKDDIHEEGWSEAELLFSFRTRDTGMSGEHPDYGGGEMMCELSSVSFLEGAGFVPSEILAKAEKGEYDYAAEAGWGNTGYVVCGKED